MGISLALLRKAWEQLASTDSSYSSLSINKLLKYLRGLETDITIEHLSSHLALENPDEVASPEQLSRAMEVIKLAGTLREPTSVKESGNAIPLNELSVEMPKLDEIVSKNLATTATTDNSSGLEGEPVMPNSSPTQPKVSYDLRDFSGYKPGRNRKEVISLETMSDGKVLVSWPGETDGSKIFLLVADHEAGLDNLKEPARAANAAFYEITTRNSCSISGGFRHLVVFEFDKGAPWGSTLGRLETVGSVSNFEVIPYTDQVQMRWQTDDPSAEVRIAKRKLSDQNSQEVVFYSGSPNSGNTKVDTGEDSPINVGDRYEYKLWIQRESGGRWIKSNEEVKVVDILGAIPSIENFQVVTSAKGPGYVDITYSEPLLPNAKVHVYQVQGLPKDELRHAIEASKFRRVPITDLSASHVSRFLGREIIINVKPKPDGKLITIPEVPLPSNETGSQTFVAVVTLGEFARIAETHVIYQIDDVKNPELLDRYDYHLARVELPEGADLLKIWHTTPDRTWAEIVGTDHTRDLPIDDDYRRNGGILFTQRNATLPVGVAPLGIEPARIFVLGAAHYDGQQHPSQNAAYVDYLGRIEVHYKLERKTIYQERRTILGKRQEPVGDVNVLKFKIDAPKGMTGLIEMNMLKVKQGDRFPLHADDESIENEVIKLDIDRFRNGAEFLTGPDRVSGPALSVALDKNIRFIPVLPDFAGIPIFVIDESVDAFKKSSPEIVARDKTYKVVIVGAKQSGKTTYVQALLHYLQNQFAKRFEVDLVPDDFYQDGTTPTPAGAFRLEELKKFLETGVLPEGTPSALPFGERPATLQNDPRIPIRFKFEGSRNVPFTALEIFDVAGEDMDKGQMELYDKELAAADLIIFLFDPMQNRMVVQAMGLGGSESNTTPQTVLRNLSALLAKVQDRNQHQKIAVALSKFDGVTSVSAKEGTDHVFKHTVHAGMSVTRDPNSWNNKQFNEIDSRQVDREAEAFIRLMDGGDSFVATVRQDFGTTPIRFFVVSALGHSNYGPVITRSGMTSYRVSDPIMWMAMNDSAPAQQNQ